MLELIEQMNRERRGTLMESLGIEFIGVGENWLEAKMPIVARWSDYGIGGNRGKWINLYRGKSGRKSRVRNRD